MPNSQADVDTYNAELKAMRHQAPSDQAREFARTMREEDEAANPTQTNRGEAMRFFVWKDTFMPGHRPVHAWREVVEGDPCKSWCGSLTVPHAELRDVTEKRLLKLCVACQKIVGTD